MSISGVEVDMRMRFSRLLDPERRDNAERGSRKSDAKNKRSPVFAAFSTGGAVRAIFSAPL
jgi:hypothetical protein